MNRSPARNARHFRSARRAGGVLLSELIDATGGVHHLLLAGVERMAVGADFDLQVVSQRRARREDIAAAAGDRHFLVFRMNRRFHDRLVKEMEDPTKGGGSLAADESHLKHDTHALAGRAVLRFLYPQKLWISLWTSAFFKGRLNWLIIDQPACSLSFNKLRASHSAT